MNVNFLCKQIRFYDIPRLTYSKTKELVVVMATRDEIQYILQQCNFGDYLLLTQLADNMERSMFCEFVKYLFNYMIEEKKKCTDTGGQEEEASDTEADTRLVGNYPNLSSYNIANGQSLTSN